MKGKKTVLVLSVIILITVVGWFLYSNTNVFSNVPVIQSSSNEPIIDIGYDGQLRCITYDSSGNCETLVNAYTNATYDVVIN